MTAPLRFADPSGVLRQLASYGVQPGGVANDSRQVRPGDLFLAFPGDSADGRKYIPEAIARGACAVLWQIGDGFSWNGAWNVPNLPETALRSLSGPLAHAICGYPCERMSLIAITGTNGKTSISQWLASLHPRRCAVIGTLGAGFPGQICETGFTTPEAATLARSLADFAATGAQACALEASSIGIEEGRLDGARVDVAVFTNLTRDHLDYHGSMQHYAEAKEKLFNWPRLRLAVINADDAFGRALLQRATASKVMAYTQADRGLEHQGAVRAEAVEETADGLRFKLLVPAGQAWVETRLVGRFNVSNLLATAAVLIDAGLTPAEVARRFADLASPPGRLEVVSVEGRQDLPLVVVDYAHTPDALENVLHTLRGVAEKRGGQLIVAFGCGGDRDRGKRPQMGEVAGRLADRVVLTSDNPRSENPAAIIADIRAAAPSAEIIEERAEAIRRTILASGARDVVLLAGKGHEPYQEIAGVRHPFLDAGAARAALASWKNKQEKEQ